MLGHNYLADFAFDDANHWKECSCGEKADTVAHTWDNGVVTKEATVDEEGIKTYSCINCGYSKDESISKLISSTDNQNTPSTSDQNNEDDGLSGGAIAGIATGSTVAVGAGGFSLFWFVIKRKSWAELLAIFKK